MKDKRYLAWLAEIIGDEPNRISEHLSYRRTRALEIIARCQMKQTEIAEQSFKEAKELRDYTIGMMKKDMKLGEFTEKMFKSREKKSSKKSSINDTMKKTSI